MAKRRLVIHYQNKDKKLITAAFLNKNKVFKDEVVYEYQDDQANINIVASDLLSIVKYNKISFHNELIVVFDSINQINHSMELPKMSDSKVKKQMMRELKDTFTNLSDYHLKIEIDKSNKNCFLVTAKLILLNELNEVKELAKLLKCSINEVFLKEDIYKNKMPEKKYIILEAADTLWQIGVMNNNILEFMTLDYLDPIYFKTCLKSLLEYAQIGEAEYQTIPFYMVISDDKDKYTQNKILLNDPNYRWLQKYKWNVVSYEDVLYLNLVNKNL